MFHISAQELESLKKHKNERYMFQVLKQSAQLKQSQPQDSKSPDQNLRALFEAQHQPLNQSPSKGLLPPSSPTTTITATSLKKQT